MQRGFTLLEVMVVVVILGILAALVVPKIISRPDEARAASAKPKQRRAVHCRECGKPLSSAAEKKRGRCADCPASYDEELFERLRVWRKETADEESVPAFVVFTDATLQLIAEQRPTSPAALLRISGVGPAKLERYGDALLGVVG